MLKLWFVLYNTLQKLAACWILKLMCFVSRLGLLILISTVYGCRNALQGARYHRHCNLCGLWNFRSSEGTIIKFLQNWCMHLEYRFLNWVECFSTFLVFCHQIQPFELVQFAKWILSGKPVTTSTWSGFATKRLLFLTLTTITLLLSRIIIMGSRLPVFTRYFQFSAYYLHYNSLSHW